MRWLSYNKLFYLSLHTPTIPPANPTSTLEILMPTTAEELENHVTPQELRTLLRRSGDLNPAHFPAPPSRLLLYQPPTTEDVYS